MEEKSIGVCPSCKFTKNEYEENQKKFGCHGTEWGNYSVISYKSQLTNQWVIECNNCGMKVIFDCADSEDDSIESYNLLPRD
jgi:hypothetical protein